MGLGTRMDGSRKFRSRLDLILAPSIPYHIAILTAQSRGSHYENCKTPQIKIFL